MFYEYSNFEPRMRYFTPEEKRAFHVLETIASWNMNAKIWLWWSIWNPEIQQSKTINPQTPWVQLSLMIRDRLDLERLLNDTQKEWLQNYHENNES